MRPVEGTILTVVRAAAEAAEAARDDGEKALARCSTAPPSLPAKPSSARPSCSRCSRRRAWSTPAAGGSRCCSTRSSRWSTAARSPSREVVTTPPAVEAHLHGDDRPSLRYEVMYLLEAEDSTIPAFKDTWASLGDSIVVVGGDGMWNCHVHTDDIGAAIEAGIEAGRPRKHPRHRPARAGRGGAVGPRAGAPSAATSRPPSRDRADAVHDRRRRGRRRRRRAAAAEQPRRARGRRRRPVDEPVDGADPRGGRALPGRVGDRAAEQQEHRPGGGAGATGSPTRRVEVVPTHSVVEALAALVAYDPQAERRRERRPR